MDSGADIIVQYEETSVPIEAAARRGKYAMGYYSDVSVIAPDSVFTSAIWNWGPYYVKTINSIQEVENGNRMPNWETYPITL